MRIALLSLLCCALALTVCTPARNDVRIKRVVVVVSIDSLRADRVGVYGSSVATTPRIDRLAAESERFEIAYAPAPFTLASMASLWTSRYPEEIGVTANRDRVGAEVELFPAALRAAGFATAAVVSNPVLATTSGLQRGFDRYDDRMEERERNRDIFERRADATTRAALEALDELLGAGRDSVFLWVHFQDPHGPYTPPPALRERFLGEERSVPGARDPLPERTRIRGFGAIPRYQLLPESREPAYYRASYDGEVAYVDAAIGDLLDGLTTRDLDANTIVVLLSDHGESLGENDYWFGHGEHLSEAELRVPLLFRVPGRAPAVRSDTASLLDVVPTLAAALGVPQPMGTRGRDLLAADAGRTAPPLLLSSGGESTVPRVGLVADGIKYVQTQDGGEELVAPRARGNAVAVGDDATRLEMRDRLETARADLLENGVAPQRREIGAEEERRLRALGYVE